MSVIDVSESHRRAVLRPKRLGCLGGVMLLLASALGIALILAAVVRSHHQTTQLQTDRRVASAWLAGVTYGPDHILKRGTPFQKWLNDRGIHGLGDYEVLKSSFYGRQGGLEMWLDYRSYLDNPSLECHRVGPTAFEDDLGQQYHGFLDLASNRTLGVYLPGYDHLARHITCTVHWMPRRPSPAYPVSRPMVFTVDLPPAKRLLPPRNSLPRGAVSATVNGITATVSDCRLGPASTRPQALYQRSLTFELKLDGGTLDASNIVFLPLAGGLPDRFPISRLNVNGNFINRNLTNNTLGFRLSPSLQGIPFPLGFSPSPSSHDLNITDPYGVSLIVPGEPAAPMTEADSSAAVDGSKAAVWCAPVNGAGRGTDVARFRFSAVVRPQNAPGSIVSREPKEASFDIIVPVQTGDDL